MTRLPAPGISHSGGIGFTSALFLTFLILKLLGKITWSWWWVTSPIWFPLVIVVVIVGTAIILALRK